MIANPVVGALLGFVPVALVAGGIAFAVVRPGVGWWGIPVGLFAATAGFLVAPVAVRGARRLDARGAAGRRRAPRSDRRGSGTRRASTTSCGCSRSVG